MARTAVLGFPRIGADRELKAALEDCWAGRSSTAALEATAREIRAANLGAGTEAGIDVLPVGDFSLYDHVLDVAEMVTLIAERHGGAEASGLPAHFLACRGGDGVTPLEMTKWFDTNYHYLVPELTPGQSFALRAEKWVAHLREAGELGVDARPVVLGPVSLLLLSKGVAEPLSLLPALTAVYAELLAALAAAGAREVQIDEPCLVLDRSDAELDAFADAFATLCPAAPLEGRVAAGPDDGALVAGGPGADAAPDEGHAHGPGHDPAVVVRPRRPAAQRDLHPDRAGDPG